MMQKKVINILLILFCLVIYGAIFFKAFWKKENSKAPVSPFKSYTTSNLNIDTNKDTIDLYLPKRSPFGTTISNYKTNSPTKKISLNNPSRKKPIITSINWPSISYYGFVKNNDKTTPLALLKIDNKLYKRREKEIVEDIVIVKVYNDSILLNLHSKTISVKRIDNNP